MKRLQSLSYKTLFTIFFLALAGIVFFLKIGSKTEKVSAAWWDDMWHYRKAINISAHTSIESNVYIITAVNIGTTTKAQADDGDFRFISESGQNLEYYIASGVGTTTINFHILIPSFPSGAQTIYAYYGNTTATNGFSTSDFSTQASNYTIGSLSAEETGGGPIAYWKFDEGVGTTAYDSAGNNSGIINKASWTNQGKTNNGLNFSPNQESLLLDYRVWKVGQTDSVTGFSRNGSAGENFRVFDTDPFGRKVVVWEASQNDITSNDDGGWVSSNIAVDQTKMYRFSTWIRRTVLGNGTYYFGTYGKNSGGTNIGIMSRSVGTTSTNPYFRSTSGGEIFSTNSWFLLVAHVWPVNSGTGPVFSDTGLYNSAGTKIATPIDFVWVNGTTLTNHRTYLYYSTDSSTRQQWIYPRVDVIDGTEPSIQDLLNGHDSYGTDMSATIAGPKESFSFWYDKNSTGNWQHITKSSSDYYVNGILNTPDEYPIYTSGNDVFIGRTTDSDFVTGSIDEVKIYNYARTADQIKQDYNSRGSLSGSSANLGIKSSTAPSIKSSLVAYYKFDENNGTTAYDSSGNNLNGTFGTSDSSPTWTQGKINKSLLFDGTNDFFSISQPNIQTSPNLFTITGFIYPENQSGKIITPQSNGIDQQINYDSGNQRIYLTIAESSDTNQRNRYSTTGSTPLNQWTHFAISINNKTIKIYINGILNSEYNETINIGGWTSHWYIGQRGNSTGWYKGYLDEVKIYNRALTAEEVKQDYNAGSAIQFGTSNQTIGGTTTSLEYCIPGDTSACSAPVAEWNFEENTGTVAKDSSGNNNNGTFGTGNSSPIWDLGVNNKGTGLKFDGINDYLKTISSTTLPTDTTISMWIYPTSWTNQTHVSLISSRTGTNGLMFFILSQGNLNFDWGINQDRWDTGYKPPLNTWTYLTISRNSNGRYLYVNGILKNSTATAGTSSTNSKTINFGSDDSTGTNQYYFQGKMDSIKIYNYARTHAQIAYDYNKGAPIGWWKLDECQGNIVNDSSGVGNTGVIVIGSSGTQNSLGTCQIGTSASWTNGASGKINSSLNFDGVDDYINIGSPENLLNIKNAITFSAWINPNEDTFQDSIISGGTGVLNGIWLRQTLPTILYLTIEVDNTRRDSVGWTPIFNKWSHVIGIGDAKNGKTHLYINGKLIGSTSFTPGLLTNIQRFYIGNGYGFFKGQIDDVRIYNYALTAEQVKTLYNGGAVNFN